uniref:HDC16123 n=1 Tax=Drosophila melanogaster TaxID=7227 RepID=Q6IJ23_DROME|nr:TPA_inf: HDC16123 [Drosophila melanogaster]
MDKYSSAPALLRQSGNPPLFASSCLLGKRGAGDGQTEVKPLEIWNFQFNPDDKPRPLPSLKKATVVTTVYYELNFPLKNINPHEAECKPWKPKTQLKIKNEGPENKDKEIEAEQMPNFVPNHLLVVF